MIEKTERQIAQEIRDIMASPMAEMYLWVGLPDELAMCCEYHPDLPAVLERYATRYPAGAHKVETVMATLAARAASRAASAAIDGVLTRSF